MKDSLRRIRALVRKEIIDFTRNNNISIVSLLPLVLVIIFGTIAKNNPDFPLTGLSLLSLGMNMNLVFVSTFAMSMMIAEEKEKQTLRTLMLSSVKPLEFIVSKAVVIFTLSVCTNAAIYLFTGLSMKYYGFYVLLSLPLAAIMMLIGACLGLITKNQMSTSVYGMPVIMLFMLLPLFASVNDWIEKLVTLLPNQVIMTILDSKILLEESKLFWKEGITLCVWFAASILSFVYIFKKRKIDY